MVVCYLAILAMMCNRIDLTAVVAGEHLGEFAGDTGGERIDVEERVDESTAWVAATEHVVLWECGVDRVLAAMTHPERV